MIIDYSENPLGIIKKFDLYRGFDGKKYHLEGRIIGITEEGFNEVNWFEIEVLYPPRGQRKHFVEIGGNLNNYEQLRRGDPELENAEQAFKKWCKDLGFEITEIGIA